MEPLTKCEIEVLVVVLEGQGGDGKNDLRDIMERTNIKNNKGWKMQTVSTFLQRLRKKNYLHYKRQGRVFQYIARNTLNQLREEAIREYRDLWFMGNTEEMKAFVEGYADTEGREKDACKDNSGC